jgi:zinc finger HIT domain-containing protein 1
MATGPLRFRTPHIEELPTTQTKQAPGFAWVAVAGGQDDPSKNWGTNNRKRARASVGGQTEQQKEALSARHQREIERRIKDLNSDNARDLHVEIPKRASATGGGTAKAGKTASTKKILASGKTFAHYLDDEEAEIARTGRRDGDIEVTTPQLQRASKTPIARRKIRENSSMSSSPAPSISQMAPPLQPRTSQTSSGADVWHASDMDVDSEDKVPELPTEAELEELLNAPPLTYNEARAAPPPSSAAPSRRFCETCGYWGRVRCMKCGTMTCSVVCKDDHDQFRCLKMYA